MYSVPFGLAHFLGDCGVVRPAEDGRRTRETLPAGTVFRVVEERRRLHWRARSCTDSADSAHDVACGLTDAASAFVVEARGLNAQRGQRVAECPHRGAGQALGPRLAVGGSYSSGVARPSVARGPPL